MISADRKKKYNKGIETFNLKVPGEAKTVIITGPSRSGTTMVAQIIENLGFNLGEKVDANLREDVAIGNFIKQQNWAGLASHILEKNKFNASWGWKNPATLEHLHHIMPHVKNPCFILTFRDPLAISTRNKIHGKTHVDLLTNMKDALNYMKHSVEWIEKHDFPCLCLSYEKSLLNADGLIEAIIEFLHLEPTALQRNKARDQVQLSNSRYLNIDLRHTHEGSFDTCEDGIVTGWANRTEFPHPPTLEVRINLKKVTEFVADQYREDLKSMGIAGGNRGFALDLNPYLAPGVFHRVEICFKENGYPLHGSPKYAD